MRFKRSDLPGFIMAIAAPPLLFLVFLASFDVWQHKGTPLLGFMATNIAGAGATLAIFARFIKKWDVALILVTILLACVAGVIWAQQTDNDGTAFATTLKWVALVDFLIINLVLGLQVLQNGLLPVLDRRDARRAAAAAETES